MAETEEIQQITNSPLCDFILEQVKLLHSGELEPANFVQLANNSLISVDRANADIISKLEAEDEQYLNLPADKTAAMKAQLASFAAAVQSALMFIEKGEEEDYEAALKGLEEAGSKGRIIFEAYNPADAEAGPTTMPMINIIYGLSKRYFAKAISLDVFIADLINVYVNSILASSELNDNDSPDSYAKSTLIKAYCNFADNIAALEPAIDQGEASVNAQLEEVTRLGEQLRQAVQGYTFYMATRGEAETDQANLILNIFAAWHEGRSEAGVVLRGLETYRKNIEDLQNQVEALISIPNEDPQINAEIEPCRDAFRRHFEAIEAIGNCVENQPELYDECRAALLQADKDLVASGNRFTAIGEQVGKVPCVRCGHYNEPSNRSCSNCGAHLFNPNAMSDSGSTMSFQEDGGKVQYGGELIMTKNLVRIFEAVNNISERKITPEAFCDTVDWFRKLIEDNLLHLAPEPESDTTGLNAEELEQLRQIESQIETARSEVEAGAQGMIDAVERMRLFISDHNTMNLVEGVRELRDASIRVQQNAKEIETLVKVCHSQAEGQK